MSTQGPLSSGPTVMGTLTSARGLWTGGNRAAGSAGDRVGLETLEGPEKRRHRRDNATQPLPLGGRHLAGPSGLSLQTERTVGERAPQCSMSCACSRQRCGLFVTCTVCVQSSETYLLPFQSPK